MEPGVMPLAAAQKRVSPAKSGFMLVTVLVITAVGLLFGAGALLLFRYQCQMRIDRQHELEKVYAVRSALNYIRTNVDEVPAAGKSLGYHTGSGRDLGLLVKPVEPIFAVLGAEVSLATNVIYWQDFGFTYTDQYFHNGMYDYEFGMTGSPPFTNHVCIANESRKYGLTLNLVKTNNVKWWVNIGMEGTGGWLQENFGRRYCFWPQDYVEGNSTKDVMRLCVIRNVTNRLNVAGRKHGWPLSKKDERALVLEIRPYLDVGNNADLELFEYKMLADGGEPHKESLIVWQNCPSMCNMGMQIADDKISLFYIDNKGATGAKPSDLGYSFSANIAQLTLDTYRYFSEEVSIGGEIYGGVYTNDVDGKVHAPELRAVFEVEAFSDERKTIDGQKDFLTDFKVTPAYQYDVFLEHPADVTNRATVAQKIGVYQRPGLKLAVITYDTHGTDNKGFRKDERDWAKKNGGGN